MYQNLPINPQLYNIGFWLALSASRADYYKQSRRRSTPVFRTTIFYRFDSWSRTSLRFPTLANKFISSRAPFLHGTIP